MFSVPGLRHGRVVQWSHMLGVTPAARGQALGLRLKLAQRERALARGIDLIEWTYDPLLVGNARLNVHRLGCVVEAYLDDVYGPSTSLLHGGLPTDRFIASWHVASPHVARRVEAGALVARDASVGQALARAADARGRRLPRAARRAGSVARRAAAARRDSRPTSRGCWPRRPTWRWPGATPHGASSTPTSRAAIASSTSTASAARTRPSYLLALRPPPADDGA